MTKATVGRDAIGIGFDDSAIVRGLHELADKVRGEVMIAGAAAVTQSTAITTKSARCLAARFTWSA